MLPNLLGQISTEEQIASVSGDGGYDTKGCHEAIALRQAHAIIPHPEKCQALEANRLGAAARRLGRSIWKKWSGYHPRSLVETKMRCFKLLGERIIERDFDRQVGELQVRAAVLNRFTRLGTPVTVPMP